MPRYLRIPFLLFSLPLLAFSSYALYRDLEGDPISLLDPFPHVATPEEKARWAEDMKKWKYAQALVEDARERIDRGDYENAQLRLDQAAAADPEVEVLSNFKDARRFLASQLGASEVAQASPTDPSQSPPTAPATEHP